MCFIFVTTKMCSINIRWLDIQPEMLINKAVYKTRNTGTGSGMRGTQGIGGMLYSVECPQILRGMSPNILGNVSKYSGNVPKLLSLIYECFTVHYVLISSNQSEFLYSFSVCKNVLLANPKETF